MQILGHEKSISCLANSTAIEEPMTRILRKSTLMYKQHAYLHHYEKEGFGKDEFEESFITGETCLAKYQAL